MTTSRRNRANRGAGFTLVEILVVIVIIGLLAGLTTTVLTSARRSVRGSIVSAQESQLSIALDQYKNRFGEYPPDLSDPLAVERHIKKRWPRYNVDYNTFIAHIELGCKLSSGTVEFPTGVADLNGQHVWDVRSHLSPLVFWLGGLPDVDGKPRGFYASPKAPLGIDATGSPLAKPFKAQREKPFYDFERKNIGSYAVGAFNGEASFYQAGSDELWDDSRNAYYYVPACCQGDYPILYFRPTTGSPYANKSLLVAESKSVDDGVSRAVPYMRNIDEGSWYEEKRFQLIHPGTDGLFGPDENTVPRVGSPATQPQANLVLEDADNVVNFATRGVLESEYQDE